jgi:hypothetical protein
MKNVLLAVALLLAAFTLWRCAGPAPAPTPAAIPTAPPKTVAQEDAIDGSKLNKAFPKSAAPYKLTFTQEKDGFAQAELTQDGKKLATLSISDTAANPSARDKFKADTKIGGYPSAAVGSQGTAVLVGSRYQVQVRSTSPAFTAAQRSEWIEKFNLDALARIK